MTPSTYSVQMSDSHSVSARHSHECPEAPEGSTIRTAALSVPLVAFLLVALNLVLLLAALTVEVLLAYSSRRF